MPRVARWCEGDDKMVCRGWQDSVKIECRGGEMMCPGWQEVEPGIVRMCVWDCKMFCWEWQDVVLRVQGITNLISPLSKITETPIYHENFSPEFMCKKLIFFF